MAVDAALTEALVEIANLQEAIADLQQLAIEDRGWDRMIEEQRLTVDGRRRFGQMCDVMTTANPLIKRGFRLRLAYVWGAGCEQTVKPGTADTQGLLPGIVDGLWSEPRNTDSLASEQAREALERWLYTHGTVVLLLHTPTITASRGTMPLGEVIIRQEDPNRIVDWISDPDDTATVWFWKRQYQARTMRRDGTPGASRTVTVWHPDIDYAPTGADRISHIGKDEVRWDQPLLVVSVNKSSSTSEMFGFGDAYAALPWARMSKEFLEAWYTLMRALARYAWKASAPAGKEKKLAAAIRQANQQVPENPTGAGATMAVSTDSNLEAVPKTGATIDATSGQPLQQMIAAALDVPLTMLLTDPGISGARAVAETLDQPMELTMGARQRLWGAIFGRLAWYKIAVAIEAGTARIPGASVDYRDGRRTVNLPDGWQPIIETNWPDFDTTPVDVLVKALRDADGLDVLPPELVARLVMAALKVKDPEDWLKRLRDSEGNMMPVSVWLSKTLGQAVDRGEA